MKGTFRTQWMSITWKMVPQEIEFWTPFQHYRALRDRPSGTNGTPQTQWWRTISISRTKTSRKPPPWPEQCVTTTYTSIQAVKNSIRFQKFRRIVRNQPKIKTNQTNFFFPFSAVAHSLSVCSTLPPTKVTPSTWVQTNMKTKISSNMEFLRICGFMLTIWVGNAPQSDSTCGFFSLSLCFVLMSLPLIYCFMFPTVLMFIYDYEKINC